ncbi:thioredoxin domain-containing protein 11 isoform X1 [Hypanus sabinus]|uniref:thioredoxin domain-containing protein 11 isoform X1 n=1 Tax=Hypanus sabinus TaxID=79690 RepID=UPI0028C4432E|nr:thioredoxin domain-containing protein 11 isoform X1 [Hypanus sabinus]
MLRLHRELGRQCGCVGNALCHMAKRPELLCGALAVICTVVTLRFALSRAKDVVKIAPPPVRFLSPNSSVIDLYMGQLDQVERHCRLSEVCVILFYAPWCGESISVREEIDQVTGKLQEQVLFLAVNCWWHQGKCRKQMNLFYYPVIHLYQRRFGPIEYRGPLTAAYIHNFIQRVMSPLQYIPTHSGLLDFLSHYEPGVLGYFEFNTSPQPPGYLTFYISALHALKRDHQGTIRFGVITSKQVAKEISVTDPGTIYMHRHFNSSLVFPHDILNFTAVNVYSWAYENRETFIHWLRPHGSKSLLLNNELKKGPALLLFFPFSPLAEKQPLMEEITEVILQYRNCNASKTIQRILQYLEKTEQADQEVHSTESFFRTRKPCCNTVVPSHWHSVAQTRNICELCINQTFGIQPSVVHIAECNFIEMEAALDSFYLREQTFFQLQSRIVECSNFLSYYSPFSYYTACCRTFSSPITSEHIDALVSSELFSSAEHSQGMISHNFPHIEGRATGLFDLHHTHIAGLSCNTNKTLNFYLLDSNLHWRFATRLGANESAQVQEFATIVDLWDEVHYVFDQKQVLNKSSIESIIKNYSRAYSPLHRHLIAGTKSKAQEEYLIAEVTTETFDNIVLDVEKNVLLLYYTQWCGFCTVLNHIFIQVARLFHANDAVVTARVNVAKNDLPWEYMVDRFPTVLFFPRNRKDLSVKYPEDLPLTVPNLVRFILLHSPQLVQQDPFHSCNPECIQKAAELQKDRISQLEEEIKRLHAEMQVLHQAEKQLASQLSMSRHEEHQLKIHNKALQEKNEKLKHHNEKLKDLYHQRNTELAETAAKLNELAAVSKKLLNENILLKTYMTSIEEELEINTHPSSTPFPIEESELPSTHSESTGAESSN